MRSDREAYVPRGVRALMLGALLLAVLAPGAEGHIERPAYWPDPAADRTVSPPAGGEVPAARSLRSALRRRARGRTRVVCRPTSLRRGLRAVRRARTRGIAIRPTAPRRRLTRPQARRHRRLLRRLIRRCRFRHLQEAVTRSANNDRIVILPGVYREEPSRAQPKNDPRCADERGPGGAATYEYHVKCPNDQSLVFVQGRALGAEPPPDPPRDSRFGIPDEGSCLRCNLQIEGAGPSPRDVVIDAGADPAAGPMTPTTAAKDVAIRADRADGLVVRRLTLTHAREHGIYVNETDGYLLDDFASLYNGQYGTLTFASDHGVTSDCDLAGHGDSGAYPGGSPDTVVQRQTPHPRLNQVVRRCDLHHNVSGFSGAMGNGVHIRDNEIYDNTVGIFATSLFPGGHPGYPQDGALIEDNAIYGNNFNPFGGDADVRPIVPVPVGVGVLVIGGNDNTVRRNRIWDNWRRGVMQTALPGAVANGDPLTAPPGPPAGTTSHRNRYFENVMGVAPDGSRSPNGVDFWWDESPGEQGNCWFGNGAVTSDPLILPASCDGVSLGTTYAVHLAELGPCLLAGAQGRTDAAECPWFTTPPRPAGARAATTGRSGEQRHARAERLGRTPEALQLATCRDWVAAGRRARRRTLMLLASVIRGARGEGLTISAPAARGAFRARCAGGRGLGDLLLYELYAMAVAMAPR